MKTHVLDATLSWSAWKNLAEGPHPVVFSEDVWNRVEQSYSFVQKLTINSLIKNLKYNV